MNPLLRVKNLTKTFAGHNEPVVEDISFCVHPGEVFTIVGPSGCGKTTTLRLIMGFEHPDAGRVWHHDVLLHGPGLSVPTEKRGIGLVFQDYALFPHLSAIRNVMFGLNGVPRHRRRQTAREALWMVGLMGMEERRPHDLSGGQQQRVALARAIAPGSRVILLDEPFSNLDPELRHNTRSEVRSLADRTGIAIVLVTHDQEEALSTADRLAVMRDGRIEQTGPPEEVYNNPKTPFVARFLGRTNLLPADASGRVARTPLGEVRLAREATGPITLSLRPEHLALRPPHNDEAVGTVVGREFKGHDMTFLVRMGRDEYVVQTDYQAPFRVGDKVTILARTTGAVVEDRQRVKLGLTGR